MVLLDEFNISINLLCDLVSNCSLDFLSTCGDLLTVYTCFFVGSGIGPLTIAPVDFIVCMIFAVHLSKSRWSNERSFILIFCEANFFTYLSFLPDLPGKQRTLIEKMGFPLARE